MNLKKIFFIALVLPLLMSCGQTIEEHKFLSGDILFRGRQNTALSKAINEVTQTGRRNNYTHMGVVECSNDTVWVIHAASGKGVCKETLSQFCLSEQDSVTVGHYRIKKIGQEQINRAIELANACLGQAYNYSYILDDDGYYCSEFVYELFATDSIFQLNPMTFIDPVSGNFHKEWVKHYNELGIDIPEGQPGCNPNGMAASPKLTFLASYQ